MQQTLVTSMHPVEKTYGADIPVHQPLILFVYNNTAAHNDAFAVEVKSTLGAGDTFKAGCVYALLHGMSDDDMVRFASACSAVAISRFPLPLNPPRLEEVQRLIKTGRID